MRSLLTTAAVSLVLTFLCGCTDASPSRGATPDGAVGGSGTVDGAVETSTDAAVDPAAIAGSTLDSLLPGEAASVCREELRRSDPCLEFGVVSTTTEGDCATAVSACRANLTDDRSTTACTSLDLGPVGSCSVTVSAYLECIDAWNRTLTCTGAGLVFGPPEPCQAVVAGCPRLADRFLLRGNNRPCSPEESLKNPTHMGDDIVGEDGCRPLPARFVVLGDSIADCTGVPDPDCAPVLIVEHLRTTVVPDLAFEMHAVAGAHVADLLGQAEGVTPGPGHVFVFIYAVGNDMLDGNFDVTALSAGFGVVFDHFSDPSLFPDGATFLLNTQYTNNDECYVTGAKMTAPAAVLFAVQDVNQHVILEVAKSRQDALAVDEYPDFLGHGVNANISGCPYCGGDNSSWIDDGLHPNTAGHAHIAAKWIVAMDRIVGPACAALVRTPLGPANAEVD